MDDNLIAAAGTRLYSGLISDVVDTVSATGSTRWRRMSGRSTKA
jgi:hypothetical protein